MSDIAEASIQAALVTRLVMPDLGWKFVAPDQLDRASDGVLLETDTIAALLRLNPVIAERPDRVEEVLPKLRAALLGVHNDGLVASNEEMTAWLAGRRTVRFNETDDFIPIRLIDFDDPAENVLVVSAEVTFTAGHETRRYDLVLYVNGFPLVVGETKTPVSTSTSWLNAANDIHNGYEIRTPAFFVPNVLSFATEGKELRYGAVRQPAEMWLPWSKTSDPIGVPGLQSVLRSVELLLNPANVLEILRTYTLFSAKSTSAGGRLDKVIPRYPQVEAVEAIVERVLDSEKRQGLVWQHQGSGKTLLMAFAAAKIRRLADLDAPTILVVLDRLDLLEQVQSEFSSVGLPTLRVAETKAQLQQLLKDDARGVIVTTIFRFKDAGRLNDRSNVVVMVDEAHRTQEGRLGLDMREALPNAQFLGLTGTPISTDDRNTWSTFGDPDDPDGVISHYSVERSIADGATLPIHIDTRAVDFHIDNEALDEAYAELAEAERLDDDETAVLAKRASRVELILKNPERIAEVCADIVQHYRTKIEPLGLKAQVVAYDRELCVAYHDEITRLLDGLGEATVVMTVGKHEPSWSQWDLDRDAEARIKDRFRDVDDPLKMVIVTAKLLTGFDAPIEGVMYLDKVLRAHTLFQAVCRTNRRWTNPNTGQEKLHGLVVDYVGLGNELAKAVAVKDTGSRRTLPSDIEQLIATLAGYIASAMKRFDGVDRAASGFDQLYAAQERLPDAATREAFAADFVQCQGLFEFLWPETALRPVEADYRWLARIYKSVAPTDAADRLLWQRLGSKTAELVHEHISDVTVGGRNLETVAIDAGVFETLRDMKLLDDDDTGPSEPPTIDEVMTTLEERLKKRLAGNSTHPVWVNISERLDALRRAQIDSAAASVDFLKRLLELAGDLVKAEHADDDGRLNEIHVVDPDIGALTQILNDYGPEDTPVIVENVVQQIDEIVRPVRDTGWQESQPGDREVRQQLRLIMQRHGFPPQGEVFDRAYAYIREHY